MKLPKISLIGAGSGAFALSLIRDLCLTKNLEGSTVSFMDIDPERLEGSAMLCKRYADELGMHLVFEQTTSREVSLQDADFVINTALAAPKGHGGWQRLEDGWKIAQSLGYRWGGSLAVMHDEAFWINFYQLQFFETLVEDILRICPDAWYMQVANSVLGGTTFLTRKYPELKMVGLCHGANGAYHIAHLLGLEREHFTFEAPGVNHFIWVTKMFYKGEDAFPLWDEWVKEKAPSYWQTCEDGDHMSPKSVDLYNRFGAIPIGDTATDGGGSWGWWYHTDDATEKRYKQNPRRFWDHYFSGVLKTSREIYEFSHNPAAKMTDFLPPKHSGEVMIRMIESIAYDIPRELIVNVANTGSYVPGVPVDFSVEVPAYVSARGVQPIQTDGLPLPVLGYLLRDRVIPVEMELAAYEQGSRDMLIELVRMDPWTRTEEQARTLVEGILNLPYHAAMREHYR